MTITGIVVMQKTEQKKENEATTSLVITDGETVDVCRTSNPTTMNALEAYTLGDEITICVKQNVYKEKVYNTIEKIVK